MTEPSADYRLPITSSGVMRLSPRLRETYLTPALQDGTCITQACGTVVHLWLWSERQNIRIDAPLDAFNVRRPYEQSIHRWGVSMNRYLADGMTDGALLVADDGEKTTVPVTVEPFEAEVMPDV